MRQMPQFIDRKNECVIRPDGAITALGDPDDHLRLAVLLGRAAQQRGHDTDDARGCVDEQTWSGKLAHLTELIDSPALRGLVLQDIDALWQGNVSGPAAWADSAFRRERSKLFEVMTQGAATGRWHLIRPVPQPSVTEALHAAGILADPAGSNLADIAPEIRPLARALLERGVIDEFGLEDMIEAAAALDSDPSQTLISLADESLSGLARDAAFRLSLSRLEQPWNGVIGPYALAQAASWADASAEVHSLPRDAVVELIAAGLLHADAHRARMPRLVRSYYERRAWATGDIDARVEHHWLMGRSEAGEGCDSEQLIERHHHAVEAEDWDAALASARYYLQDLRQLATRIGRRPGLGSKRQAALIFARITRRDPHDAYAWEYYGYNLAQVGPPTPMIEHAYDKASELEPDNPLYRGRLMGWRGCQGVDVVDETRHRISEYGISSVAASWFAYQVLQGLARGRQHDQLARLREALGASRVERWREKQPAHP